MGSAFEYKGLQLLLDGVLNYLPFPIEASNYTLNQSNNGEKHTLVAYAHVVQENYGFTTFLKIYEGVIRKGDFITNVNTGKTFQVPHLYRWCNNELEVIPEAHVGETVSIYDRLIGDVDYPPGVTFTEGFVRYRTTSVNVHGAFFIDLTRCYRYYGMKYMVRECEYLDTHNDFKPTNKALENSVISLSSIVEQEVKDNPVMLYMNGVPDFTKCEFSYDAVRVLNLYAVALNARNILDDPEMKNAIKAFSHCPTFPQIFIKGEFIGGSDIVLKMHQTGELKEMLKDMEYKP